MENSEEVNETKSVKLYHCDYCAHMSTDKRSLPCSMCPYNKNFKSSFTPHQVCKNLIEAGVIKEEDLV